jgi:stress response protein SCP2
MKFLLWSVVLILIIGLAGGAYWWTSRPQVITFSDDAKLTLVKVEYGKHHAAPTAKAAAKPAAKPAAATPARRGGTSSFTTPTDTLVLWVRQEYDANVNLNGNQYHNFQYYVYDAAETACVQTYGVNYTGNNRGGSEVVAVRLDAFPHRTGKLHVRVQEQGNGGQELSEQKFVVSNPAGGKSFAKWTAEPLPSTKEDGDLSVTLTKLVAGADTPYQRNQDNPDDAMNKGVQVAFHIERAGKQVTNWAPVSVETTDATGNRTAINYGPNSGNQVQWNGDEGTFTYQYGLWPNEPAWKLRMEMTQTSDFSNDEQWTAQNIPVVLGSQQSFNNVARGRGNAPAGGTLTAAEADLNGHHIKVFPAVQFTNAPPNYPQQGGLIVQIQPALMNNGMRPMNAVGVNATQAADDGLRMTLAKTTDGQGGEITTMSSGWSTSGMGGDNSTSTFRFTFRDIAGVTNINATIALHKNRFVEFTAKPSKQEASNKN